jgi:hypothetical protein
LDSNTYRPAETGPMGISEDRIMDSESVFCCAGLIANDGADKDAVGIVTMCRKNNPLLSLNRMNLIDNNENRKNLF